MSLTYEQMDVHARKHYLPGLIDNVFVGHPFLAKLMSKNKVVVKGGTKIVQPILYGKVKSGAYRGLERFDISPVETRTLAEWEWKNRWANITITGDDMDKANGDQGLLDLLSAEIQNAEMTIRDDLASDLVGDGTGEGGRAFDGLENAISSGTYGGISPSDISTWVGQVDDQGGAVTIPMVKEFMGLVTYGTDKPDLILTTQTIYDALWAQAQPAQRGLQKETILAKLGYSGIEIDGAQILVDRHVPTGKMYGINTKYWKLIIHPKKQFKWTSNKELIDADGYVRQILLKGNFICVGRRYNFKVSNLVP